MAPLLLLLLLCLAVASGDGDADALLALKAAVDINNTLPWRRPAAGDLCGWPGVRGCTRDGRVSKLVLEFLNLTGELPPRSLAPLDQLRVLSLKSNAISGDIPDLSPLVNLKSIYLGRNRFTGRIPAVLASFHRIKIVSLEGNRLSGEIPPTFASIPRLYSLFVQDNLLSGGIPGFDQKGLSFFNVSGNRLSGEVPETRALSRFSAAAFGGNPGLCGSVTGRPCSSLSLSPAISPAIDVFSPPESGNHGRKRRVIAIIAGSVAGAVFLLICLTITLVQLLICRKKGTRSRSPAVDKPPAVEGDADAGGAAAAAGGEKTGAWEGEGAMGRLEFCGGGGEMYGLDELLRASAETLGRGTVGSTYKAVMETGFIVTVKRLKEAAQTPGPEEFRRRMEEIGRLRHPNLVPLRAYFQAKEERLLVYDYFPNGSLFSLIHGSRPSGSGKPLHWTSCLKIAEDVATGLLYLHQSGTVHGNVKSSNVLLGSDFESCLTDYTLIPYLFHDEASTSPAADSPASAFLFYRAPESRARPPTFTPQADVYGFGVLLLELLTGKTPFQDLVERYGADIPRWVRSVREDESAAESGGDEQACSGNEEEKLAAMVGIATACVAVAPEGRPQAKEVLRMIREARAEALVSSNNSSDHSPGRWSDTVQSLPREHGSDHFAERD